MLLEFNSSLVPGMVCERVVKVSWPASLKSGRDILFNGLVCNPFGLHFCVDLITTNFDLSTIFSPFVPD